MGGGYAAAAYMNSWWPFSLGGTSTGALSKKEALAKMFDSLTSIQSASYQMSFTSTAEEREAGAVSLDITFPELAEEKKKFERDQNRFRDINSIQKALQNYYFSAQKYPDSLNFDSPNYPLPQSQEYRYAVNADALDYTLAITFETDEAVKAMQNYGYGTQRIVTEGKTVAISKIHGSYFSFYGEPRQPSWVQFIESYERMFSAIPAEYMLDIHVKGTADREATKDSDAAFGIGGSLALGDLSFAADVEMLKNGDTYYGRVNKMPALGAFDLSKVKQQWIKVSKDELATMAPGSSASYFAGASYLSDSKDAVQETMAQLKDIVKSLYDEDVMQIDMSLPDETIETRETYVYTISYNEQNVAPWYEKITTTLKERHQDKALFTLDPRSLELMKSKAFTDYLGYIKNNTTFTIYIDKETGYPSKFTYSIRLVPKDSVVHLREKQIMTSFSISLADVNQPVSVEAPADFITLEDAIVTLTGITKNEYRFSLQNQNIAKIRTALRDYKNYHGVYPASLSVLEEQRGEKKTAIKPLSSLMHSVRLAAVSIDFPEDFEELNDDPIYDNGGMNYYPSYTDDEYEKKLRERPFIIKAPRDAYSGAAFDYKAVNSDSSYELRYTMTVPEHRKTNTTDSGYQNYQYNFLFRGVGEGISINDALKYVNGINTANDGVLSVEAQQQLQKDDDADGLPNLVENYYGSSNTSNDSDDDGYEDADEVKNGYDPAGPGKLPYNDIWYSYNSSSQTSYNPYYNTTNSPDPLRGNNTSARTKATYASAKGSMNAILAAVVLCQDNGDSLQTGNGKKCQGAEAPQAGKPVCDSNIASFGNWPSLPAEFVYGSCNGNTEAATFSYKATDGVCTMECTEKGCNYSGC